MTHPSFPSGEDDEILRWCEREARILVARDKATLPRFHSEHLAAGRHSAGVFLVRDVSLAAVVEFLVCVAYASDAREWQDRVVFIP